MSNYASTEQAQHAAGKRAARDTYNKGCTPNKAAIDAAPRYFAIGFNAEWNELTCYGQFAPGERTKVDVNTGRATWANPNPFNL